MCCLEREDVGGGKPYACRSELAREKPIGAAFIQETRVIVDVLREQARSYQRITDRLETESLGSQFAAICSEIRPRNQRSAGSLSCTPLHTIDSSAASIANGGSSARKRVPSVKAQAA